MDREERRRQLEPGARSIATPRPLLGTLAQPCAYRVEHDVPARLEEMGVSLYLVGKEAILKEVADAAVTSVHPARKPAVEQAHSLRETTERNLNDQMEMVRHQAVGEHDPAVASRRLVDRREEEGAVTVVRHDLLAVIAACGDVIDATGLDYASRTGHEPNLAAPPGSEAGRARFVTPCCKVFTF